MNKYDIQHWVMEEKCIIQIAHIIQLHYGISGTLPLDTSSSFHLDHAHKTQQIVKHMICLAKEWFAFWMGLSPI